MGQVATDLGHVLPSLRSAVYVDDRVAVLDQMGPDLVGDPSSC